MAISYDNNGNSSLVNDSSSPYTVTWSHTCAGWGRLLVVAVTTSSEAEVVTGVTYNGDSLTHIRDDTGVGVISLWYMVGPDVGTYNVVATFDSGFTNGYGMSVSLNGVDQSTPLDANNGGTSTDTNDITTVITTVASNAWVVDAVYKEGSLGTLTAGGSQTGRVSYSGAVYDFGMSTLGPISPAGDTNISWTDGGYTGDFDWVHSVASFKATTASPSSSPSSSPSEGTPSHSPSNSPSEGTPSNSPSQGTPSNTPSASPSQGTPSNTPSSSPSEGTPSNTPSATPSSSPSEGTPSSTPSGSPSGSPSEGTPSNTPSGSPSGSPSEGTPSGSPSSTPSSSPSEGTPSSSPSVPPETSLKTDYWKVTFGEVPSPSEGTPSGSPSATPSEGTPSASPSEATPSGSPSEGTGSASPSEATPSGSPSEGTPSGSPSEGTPSGSPSEGTPSAPPPGEFFGFRNLLGVGL